MNVRVCALALLAALLLTATAQAHPERPTKFPDPNGATVPEVRTSGPVLVVCNAGSGTAIKKVFKGKGRKTTKLRRQRLALLKKCRFKHIQAAVDAAKTGDRIQILPGTYREEPSREVRHNDPGCGALRDPGDGHGAYALYAFHLKCPTSRNLIFIGGDSNDDGTCDAKCRLQMEGMGKKPTDVRIIGDRVKEDVIRADRADGFVLRNVSVEQGAFNGVDVVETNGFRLEHLEAVYNQNYGVLTFTSDNGLYDTIEAYGNGDSGVYPGSGPERHCQSYGIEIRNVDSHDNVLGYSGTAGNGTWVHDSKFHHNSAGISDDSFASGHPGMPQDCSKWEDNEVYSNNVNFFTTELQQHCAATPFEKLEREEVCPQFQVPVGAGFILYGVNDNIIRRNRVWDNWRSGVRLFWVPGVIRGETSPEAQFDTSNGNRFIANTFGKDRDGRPAPNGVDVFWDEQGMGNCWDGNVGLAPGGGITSDPATLSGCPGSLFKRPVNAIKAAAEIPCASWNPRTNQHPVGCVWFDTPKRPTRR
ncbi:right-handed parallel beta-helix repeat-containing protein [Conexibacter sp. SYSU D00693]|uniref:right-handed parallel beta-helix repeat-containing protein n=1 Tax=Conexibacter sp. SYSU D00693 TaxID=2812560 RepID=UPI00196A95F0|nr:right-handed parallel beta-helix repeat-containing protein [Conexibacter sp. SYSU D00693]